MSGDIPKRPSDLHQADEAKIADVSQAVHKIDRPGPGRSLGGQDVRGVKPDLGDRGERIGTSRTAQDATSQEAKPEASSDKSDRVSPHGGDEPAAASQDDTPNGPIDS